MTPMTPSGARRRERLDDRGRMGGRIVFGRAVDEIPVEQDQVGVFGIDQVDDVFEPGNRHREIVDMDVETSDPHPVRAIAPTGHDHRHAPDDGIAARLGKP
jgi:hypothetical protein